MLHLLTRRAGVLALTVVALVAPAALAAPASASLSANEVVYTVDGDNDGSYAIVLRDLLTRTVTTVLPAAPVEEWIYDDPELSPDGSRVAFSTDRGSGSFDEGIAVVDRDGRNFRRLTSPPSSTDPNTPYAIDVAAAWSPDSATLLFTRITTDLSVTPTKVTTALFTVPAAGGTVAALAGAPDGYTGDWSPTGNKIVFAAVAPDGESGPLFTMNADGSGRTALGPTGLMPTWSPDGSTIAYATITSTDPDRTRARDITQIATVPATGGPGTTLAVTQPTSEPTVAEYPTWTPDGESILFDLFGYSTTSTFPPGDLWAVDRQGVRAGRIATTAGDEAQPFVHGPVPSVISAGAASTYTPVTPRRILDTRNGTGVAATATVGMGGTVDLAVRGVMTAQGAVPSNATAAVLNVTVTDTTAPTDVRVYPSGTPVPGASNVNAGARQTVPNLVTVRIGDNGAVTLRNAAGTVNLIADIAGWYTPDAAGLGFAALDPGRILDTRSGVGAAAGKVGPAGFVDLQVTGSLRTAEGGTTTVPAGARAVVLNVTATGVTASTNVRVYPTTADGAFPTVSNLNVGPGQTAPNLVTVAVGQGAQGGQVRLRNANGSLHLIADIAGYYAAGATGRFVPVVPTRFLDTRSGVGAAPILTTAGGVADLKVAGARGVPAGATAAVLNLTGTGVSSPTDVRAYPFGAAKVPTVSNLNLTKGTTRANLVIVRMGTDGRVRVRNAAGEVNLIGDLAGYMIG